MSTQSPTVIIVKTFLSKHRASVQVLVGNKCDMEESKRKVPYSQGQALADEFGIQFFETSAKNNIKVDEVCSCPSLACPTQAAMHFRLHGTSPSNFLLLTKMFLLKCVSQQSDVPERYAWQLCRSHMTCKTCLQV